MGWPKDRDWWIETLCGVTDEEGERAIRKIKASMPSKRQTEYNQRDIKKRNRKQRGNK